MEETNSATPAPIEENRSQKAVESNQLGLKAVALYSYDKQDEDEVSYIGSWGGQAIFCSMVDGGLIGGLKPVLLAR